MFELEGVGFAGALGPEVHLEEAPFLVDELEFGEFRPIEYEMAGRKMQ